MSEMLAYDESDRGSVALRRRTTDAGLEIHELIVNGTFVMDTVETSTERRLAALVLDRAARLDRVVVGGLGLGFTLAALLAAGTTGPGRDCRVEQVEVVELESAVVHWIRDGLVPETRGVLDDPRVRVEVEDIRAYVRALPPGSVDAIVLDVDNGPDFLVHLPNVEVYEKPFLASSLRALRPGGVLAVWSAARASGLRRALTETFGGCEEIVLPVRREGRAFDYYLYATGCGVGHVEPDGQAYGKDRRSTG